MRRAARQSGAHVSQRGGRQRADHAKPLRVRRQGALAQGIEQALGFQRGLETQEFFEQHAVAGALHAFGDKLQFTSRLVHRQSAPQFHQLPFGRREIEHAGSAPKYRATQHRAARFSVFEIEVAVPAGGA